MAHGPFPTVSVQRAVMSMRWEQLTFLHWRYPTEAVQRLLPAGVTVQTFDGSAWVSLVPFVMRVVLPGGRIRLPFVDRFAETNVRTYVTAADGTEGIWFFSLDASSALAVAGGRGGYRLAYMWSRMTVERSADEIRYSTDGRRWPRDPTATSEVAVRIGQAYEPNELTEIDHWLSARWRLYSRMFGRVWGAHAEHEPWPLRRADLLRCDDRLLIAAGLASPIEAPIVQYADGVSVRIGRPFRIRPAPLAAAAIR
jgi:uncharacterized protein